MTVDRPDPFRSVACELLGVLVGEARPMSLRELQADGRMARAEAARQLSIARVAGFVRSVPAPDRRLEPCYEPTALGSMIGRRTTHAMRAARELRAASVVRPVRWAAPGA